jgi:hypothetical protein
MLYRLHWDRGPLSLRRSRIDITYMVIRRTELLLLANKSEIRGSRRRVQRRRLVWVVQIKSRCEITLVIVCRHGEDSAIARSGGLGDLFGFPMTLACKPRMSTQLKRATSDKGKKVK